MKYTNAKYVVAFTIDFDLDPRIHLAGHGGMPLAVRCYFNCAGKPRPAFGVYGSSSLALDAPGAEWAFPKYACRMVYNDIGPMGIFIDRRSLHHLLGGCCPTEIGNDMTGIWNVAD